MPEGFDLLLVKALGLEILRYSGQKYMIFLQTDTFVQCKNTLDRLHSKPDGFHPGGKHCHSIAAERPKDDFMARHPQS
jgi:hypothetical protein